jgi:hypothetical protein
MVAVDSCAACSQGLRGSPGSQRRPPCAESQCCRNIHIDDHFRPTKCRCPIGPDMTFCVQSYAAMTSASCAMCLRGTGVSARSVPHLKPSAPDFELPSKQHWPQRGRGRGDAPGPTTRPIAHRISVSRKGTESLAGLLSVGFSTRSTRGRKRCARPATTQQHFGCTATLSP